MMLKLAASVPTSSPVSTRTRSCRCPSPRAEAEAARLLMGLVKRPTAQTASSEEAASVKIHAAASRSTERPPDVPSGAATPAATLHPEGCVRVTAVTRLTPSLQSS